MNTELKKFLDFILNPENRFDINNYIASRKINDNNLTLTCGYLNGAAWILGVAFDQLIKVRFNYFEHSCGFYVNIDGTELTSTVSKFVLDHFFTNGVLLGHPDQPSTLRPVKDMNYYIWEAVVIDVQTLCFLKLISDDLYREAANISKETVEGNFFSDELKERACKVEFEVSKYRKELDAHYGNEDKARI
ncbi:hypothetical protein AH04_9 [Erwinia phage AH04]|uniref:Uncharacterized protein n=1 Tax=Erwinia phage AH04 TaxID=2869569 RepID=A0AAE8BQ07_9CAUD|nr:hypothetical protein PQC02_gp009 [Erwinia phage AH04]QZA70499.1 hypothetical protein AH04_9 [Erwinia phage AH04]